MRDKIAASRNFVLRHKTGLAVTATALICLYVHIKTIAEVNEFLKEHDLFDEMYALSEED